MTWKPTLPDKTIFPALCDHGIDLKCGDILKYSKDYLEKGNINEVIFPTVCVSLKDVKDIYGNLSSSSLYHKEVFSLTHTKFQVCCLWEAFLLIKIVGKELYLPMDAQETYDFIRDGKLQIVSEAKEGMIQGYDGEWKWL